MKQTILNILDFLRYKVDNDECTAEELRKFSDIATKELNTNATIDELSEFYGQSRSNVSNVISRRPIPKDKKPKRRIYYNFAWFDSIIPDSWKQKKSPN
jgi:hypothetical protein